MAFYAGVISLLMVAVGAAYVRHADEHPLHYAEGTCQLSAPSDEGKRTVCRPWRSSVFHQARQRGVACGHRAITVPGSLPAGEAGATDAATFGTIVRPKNAEVPRSFDWVFAGGLVALLFGVLCFAISRSPPVRDD